MKAESAQQAGEEGGHRGVAWGRVVPFMVLGAVLQMGLAIGISAADSLFIVNVGADRLPIIYAVTPLLMLAYIAAYTRLLARRGIDVVFNLTLGALVVGGVGFAVLLTRSTDMPVPLLYGAKLYATVWYIAIYSLLWNFVDGYFNLVDAKRVFGFIAGGAAAGAIAGGALVSVASEALPVAWFFLFWAGSGLMAWPVLGWIRHRVKRVPVAEDVGTAEALGMRQVFGLIRGTRYVWVLTLLIFLTLVTATLCEFRYMTIFEERLRSAEELAAVFGRLYAGANVLNLVVTLFIFEVLVRRLGVRNVALIQPVVYLATFSLLLLDGGMLAAMAGFVAYQGLMTSIDYNNVNLLFNGLPEVGKKEMRTAIEGICEPVATATAGLFLLWGQGFFSAGGLSLTGFILAAVCLIFALLLRNDYGRAVANNVRRSWLDFARGEQPVTAWLPAAEHDLLKARATDGTRARAERLAAYGYWLQLDPESAAEALLQERWWEGDPTALVECEGLLSTLLAQGSPAVRATLEPWMRLRAEALPPALGLQAASAGCFEVEQGRAWLAHGDADRQAAGAVVLWRQGGEVDRVAVRRGLDAWIADGGAAAARAWSVVAEIGEHGLVSRLRSDLLAEDADVRRSAQRCLARLVGPEASPLQTELLDHWSRGEEVDERNRIIDTLQRIGDSAVVLPLLERVVAIEPAERRRLENFVVGFGARAIPAVVKVLRSPRYSLAARSVAARALGRLSFPHLEELLPELMDQLVGRMFRLTAFRHVLNRETPIGPGHAALTLVFRDLPDLTLELAFELLNVAGRLPGFEAIVAALRSTRGKERGFAIESIEQACGRGLFLQFQPFLDRRGDEEVVREGRRLGLVQDLTLADVIAQSLGSAFPFEASAALQAAVEREPGTTVSRAVASLRSNSHAMVRETARRLLARVQVGAADAPTPVERILRLARLRFFASWGLRPLELIAARLTETRHRAGERVIDDATPATAVGFASTGRFRWGDRVAEASAEDPLVIGREALGEPADYRTAVWVEQDACVVWIPARVMRACVQVQPRIGLDLLRWKLGEAT